MPKPTEQEKLKDGIKKLRGRKNLSDRQGKTLRTLKERLKAITPKKGFAENIKEKLTNTSKE